MLTLDLGVGTTKPNEEDEIEEPEDLVSNNWRGILEGDHGTYSLKPWDEVSGANKVNLALALREIIRQAWGEFCITSVLLHPSQLNYLVNSGRRGKVAWGEIDSKPHNLIHPKFILETKLKNPTRMSLGSVEAYWKAWALKASKGDPFSFLIWKGKEKEKGGEEEEEEEERGKGESEGKGKGVEGKKQRDEEDASEDEQGEEGKKLPASGGSPIPFPPDIDIDQSILLPCKCDTHCVRTRFLQELISKVGDSGKTFHALVKLVETLEVSPMLITSFLPHLTLF